MTDKQAVMDALQRLPDNASLDDISEEIEIMAAIRRGRGDIAEGRFSSQENVRKMVHSWSTEWNSK